MEHDKTKKGGIDMANTKSVWGTILKVAIAVLSAIAGALGMNAVAA